MENEFTMQVGADLLRLFEVREFDSTSLVLARDEDDAVTVLLCQYGYDTGFTPERIDADLGWRDGRPESIVRLTAEQVKARSISDDDSDAHVSLANACAEFAQRGVVASTET